MDVFPLVTLHLPPPEILTLARENRVFSKIMTSASGKFSLTDTVEIVHRIGNIGKKEIYKKALDIQNEK